MAKSSYFVTASVFLLSMGFFLAKVGRDSLMVQERGLWDLPLAYAGIAVLAAPVAMSALALMRVLGPRRARLVYSALISSLLLLFSQIVHPGGGPLMMLFFMFVTLAWGVLYSMSWLLAGELLEGRPGHQLARAYGLIGGGTVLGGLLGGLLARAIIHLLPPEGMIGLAAIMVALSGAVIAFIQFRWPPAMTTVPSTPAPSPRFPLKDLLHNRYGRLMLAVGMCAGLVGVLLEFQFYLSVAGAGGPLQSDAYRFADIYIVLNGAALALQILVLPQLNRWVGVGGGLLILPAALSGGAGTMAIGLASWGAGTLKVAEGGLKSSLHRPHWEQAYLHLARADRPGAKLLVDGVGVRVAEGVAAGFLFLWLAHHGTVARAVAAGSNQLTGMLVFFTLVWLFLGLIMRMRVRVNEKMLQDSFPMPYDMPLPDG